jgi:hypothetical protein
MATVSGTFTAVGQSATLDVTSLGEDITISLTGGATATVELQREKVPYSGAWQTIRTYYGNVDASFRQERKNERYRFDCVAYTSGTVTYSVSDGDKQVGEFVDDEGNEIITYSEAGVAIPGTLSVTGTQTFTGATTLATGSTVGTITLADGSITDSGGALDFGNENLSTTGTLAAGVSTLDGIAGGDSALGIDGEAAAQGGSVDITGGTSSTAGNVGGVVTVTGGTPGATSAGAAVSVAGGAGGATSGAGGQVNFTSGAGSATAAGGASGNVVIASGITTNSTTETSSNTGTLSILSGAPGTATTGVGGTSGTVTIGSADGALISGDSDANSSGSSGNVTIQSGAGGAHAAGTAVAGSAGTIAVTAGAGGADSEAVDGTSGTGGAVVVTAGAGGAGATAGVGGQVHLRSAANTPVLMKRAVAGTGTDAEVLTTAELFNGIFIQTPSAAATTCTTPTGAQISAGLGADLAVGDSFMFTLINAGGTTAYDVTLTAGATGVTITGSAIIAPAADDPAEVSAGTWIFVNTASDTWIAYRM